VERKIVEKFYVEVKESRNPRVVYIPKNPEEYMQSQQPGEVELELIEEIFEELKDRLCYLEIYPGDGKELSEGDMGFNDAVTVFDDLLGEVEDKYMEEYGAYENDEEEELDDEE